MTSKRRFLLGILTRGDQQGGVKAYVNNSTSGYHSTLYFYPFPTHAYSKKALNPHGISKVEAERKLYSSLFPGKVKYTCEEIKTKRAASLRALFLW
jgi:hypothetical protein